MASTSASSVQQSFRYDVFLSFRGEDTRKNFVDHLYHALEQTGIDTYRDDEKIKKGEKIGEQLIKSIEDSRFYIIVFSKNYASSSWCLDELVKITECQEANEHTAYPVFYDVEPTEVRKQSGAVGDAFAKHKDDKSAGKWRAALRCAADLAGWELKNTSDGHEAMLIQKVVKEISLELRYIDLSDDPKLIGMKERVRKVVSKLETDIDDVRMIGIKGMGGGGKTTLGKAVFDQISDLYEGSSFVENVRESTKVRGLKSLQKKILSDVLKDSNIGESGAPDLKRMMQKKMKCRKVLVILDDADHMDQLEALAGETSWFKPGSRVIITTREEQVLVAHRVPKTLILDVNLLSREEASCLFNRYAFGREIPGHGFEKLSNEFVRYAAGLPLTIKVLGSLLCGRDELEWEDELERLKTIPLMETLRILELSFNSLEEDRKEIFLDVACILKGWEKEKAIMVLESRGFHARSGLKVLEQKSLITVSKNGRLSMHDHIEEMGKNIVRCFDPTEPYKHSRLWIEEEVKDILMEDKGTEATRCLKVPPGVDSVLVMKGLRKMKELRYLEYESHFDDNCDDLGEDGLYLPDSLQYLYWCNSPLICLPKSFQANHLVGLQMKGGNIKQLWEGGERKDLKKLRFINLSRCPLEMLDIRMSQNLEWLELFHCPSLVELLIPVQSFKLKFISIFNCELTTLDLAWAKNLESLTVGSCQNLVELVMLDKCLKLKDLKLISCGLKTLDIARAKNLETLEVEFCQDLVELVMPDDCLKLKDLKLISCGLKTLDIARAKNLEKLRVRSVRNLAELVMPDDCLKLKDLKLENCVVKTLDLAWAKNLETLEVEFCHDLVELVMPDDCLKLKDLKLENCVVKTLDLAWAKNLETLEVEFCHDLVELVMPDDCLKLKDLKLDYCVVKTLDIAGAKNLEKLTVRSVHNLAELVMPDDCLKLKDLKLISCGLKTLDIARAKNLETLEVEFCHGLVELVMPDDCLKLKDLKLENCVVKTLDLAWAKNLETLEVEFCHDLVELVMPDDCLKLKDLKLDYCVVKTLDIAGAKNLEKLTVRSVHNLAELVMPDDCLKLKDLKLISCGLKTLDIARAKNLETLEVEFCHGLVELVMPDDCLKLKDLKLDYCVVKTLDIAGAKNLEKLTVRSVQNLAELVMPDDCLKLKDLKLDYCVVKTLDIAGAKNLEKLTVRSVQNLAELVMPDDCLKLKDLNLANCGLKTLYLSRAKNLETLEVEFCQDLVELVMPDDCLKLKDLRLQFCRMETFNLMCALNLKNLKIRECEDLEELHLPVENFKLESLHLYRSKLKTLDLAGAQNLETLTIEKCDLLVELHMPVESLMLKDLSLQCFKLKTLNLTSTLNLESLNLKECVDLRTLYLGPSPNLQLLVLQNCYNTVEIHTPIGCLSSRLQISSSGCVRFNPILVNQGPPTVLAELHLTATLLAFECQWHPGNNLHHLRFECKYEEPQNITYAYLWTCTNLSSFLGRSYGLQFLRKLTLEDSILEVPVELEQLECLEELNLLSTKIEHLPESICTLKHLKSLKLKSCWLLKQLPEDLGRLECLEELHLTDCIFLQHIPNSICEIKRLKNLHLPSCLLVEKLPEEIGRLKCLKELNIECTGISDLPQSIFQLKGLLVIGSRWRLESYGITSVMENSEYPAYCYI